VVPEKKLPAPVIAVVAETLGDHYSHTKLDVLFAECGAPGDAPPGNKVDKCLTWLRRCNMTPEVDAFRVLGRLLENLMEYPATDDGSFHDDWRKKQERVRRVLADNGLAYRTGGHVGGAGPLAAKTLEERLRAHEFQAVDDEFGRAVANLEADPPAALTAARAIMESIFKVYIAEKQLPMPKDASEIGSLWKIVREDIGLDPKKFQGDQDIRTILGALGAIVEGVAALRSRAGSAHGHATKYSIAARHARLAVGAAHALVLFLIETWEDRRKSG